MKKAAKKKVAKKKVAKKKTAKAAGKTSAAKKSAKSARAKRSSQAVVGKVDGGLVDKQPQVKEKAAVAHAMFLFTDDAWAQRYFDQNDLHFLEREVFG